MGIDAFTSEYGISKWGRPTDLTFERKYYGYDFTQPNWWDHPPIEKTDSWTDTAMSQLVTRSAKLSGLLVSWNGHQIRMPTNYDLSIYERSQFGRRMTHSDKVPGYVDISKNYSDNPSFADVAYLSGLYSGYTVRHLSDASNEAQTVALNRLTGGMQRDGQQASFGSALAQSRSTLSDIGRLSTALLGGIGNAMKGNMVGALASFGLSPRDATVRGVADKFLFWNYGVKPTVGDLADLHSAMVRHKDNSKFLTVSGRSQRTESRGGTSGQYSWQTDVKTTARCKIRAMVIDPTIHSLSTQGLINPLSIAWDLVPYSFVLDWFSPIGDILRGYESSLGLQFVLGFVTQVTEGSSTMEVIPFTNGPDHITGTPTKDITYHFTRSALDRFPVPDLYMKQNWMSTFKGAEALALLTQLHRG